MSPRHWLSLQHFVMALAGVFWVWVLLTFVGWIGLNSAMSLSKYPWVKEGAKKAITGLWAFLVSVGTFFLLKKILPW